MLVHGALAENVEGEQHEMAEQSPDLIVGRRAPERANQGASHGIDEATLPFRRELAEADPGEEVRRAGAIARPLARRPHVALGLAAYVVSGRPHSIDAGAEPVRRQGPPGPVDDLGKVGVRSCGRERHRSLHLQTQPRGQPRPRFAVDDDVVEGSAQCRPLN